jgi:hypothetical protein
MDALDRRIAELEKKLAGGQGPETKVAALDAYYALPLADRERVEYPGDKPGMPHDEARAWNLAEWHRDQRDCAALAEETFRREAAWLSANLTRLLGAGADPVRLGRLAEDFREALDPRLNRWKAVLCDLWLVREVAGLRERYGDGPALPAPQTTLLGHAEKRA